MNKQVKLKAKETVATNLDFYNLFRPIAPSINIIGKVAQVISGLTEAITIWYITQSEMAGSSKFVSILVSIVAMVLVVAILELGGRKFLQVLTRALVWKRLKNAWSVGLFAIVTAITIGIGVLSFRLSTNGINHAFVSSIPVGATFDASALKTDYQGQVKDISNRFTSDFQLTIDNHKELVEGTHAQYNARISTASLKVKEYDQKYAQGLKWAKSQGDKYRKKIAQLKTEKANAIANVQKSYSQKLEHWQDKKDRTIEAEKASLHRSIAKGELALTEVTDSHSKNANFRGGLFSFFVGFSVVLAFICIISTEVYRRGSGIEVAYREEETDLPIATIFWKGLTGRIDAFFRSKAESFAKVESPKTDSGRIGFDFPRALPNNEVDQDFIE